MQSAKAAAANVAAIATAGLEKTKAAVQEKVEMMSANDPVQKKMATEKKQYRQAQAELDKQDARAHNAAAKKAISAGGQGQYTATGTGADATPGNGGTHMTHQTDTHPTTGALGQQPGTHPSELPADTTGHNTLAGHGTGNPHGGYVEEGVATTHPSELQADTTGHNTPAGHGTGNPHGGYVEEGVATTHPSELPADTTGHHGAGNPHGGYVEEGVATTHPSELPADTTGHNTLAGGTGGTYEGHR